MVSKKRRASTAPEEPDYVCSFETGRALKKAHVPQQSIFYWNRKRGEKTWYFDKKAWPDSEHISAFTSGELGERLKNIPCPLPQYNRKLRLWVGTKDVSASPHEAEARARSFLRLIDINFLSPTGKSLLTDEQESRILWGS